MHVHVKYIQYGERNTIEYTHVQCTKVLSGTLLLYRADELVVRLTDHKKSNNQLICTHACSS